MECCPNLVDAGVDPVAWAEAREAEGWPVISASDHLWDTSRAYPHWAVTLTQLAMTTTSCRVASSFANNLLRSPVEFAQAAFALHRASGGRFEAGLGAGWSEGEITGTGQRYPTPSERAGRYAEAMHVVRTLFDTGACTFAGAVDTLGGVVGASVLLTLARRDIEGRMGSVTLDPGKRRCRMGAVSPVQVR